MTNKITDYYPVEFLQWIELPRDDKNAEVIFQMFSNELSREEALSFWNLRQRAFKELKHQTFTDMVRAAASFSTSEDEIINESKKRKVDIEEVRIAYKELQERYKRIMMWRLEELEEKAKQEELKKKEKEEYRLQKQKKQQEKLLKSGGQSYRQIPKDKNDIQREKINSQILQKENQLDDLARLSRHLGESNEQFLGTTHSLLTSSEELSSQTTRYNKEEAYREQSIFSELQQALNSSVNHQNNTVAEIGRKARHNKEEQLENLYQERNKLAW